MASSLDRRYRPCTEPERLEAGFLEPGEGPAPWSARRHREHCAQDVSCYSTEHEDLCPVRDDPFRSDKNPTWSVTV
jgi:hypothetical protein